MIWRTILERWFKNRAIWAFVEGLAGSMGFSGKMFSDDVRWAAKAAKIAGHEAKVALEVLPAGKTAGKMLFGKSQNLFEAYKNAGKRIAFAFSTPFKPSEIRLLVAVFKEGLEDPIGSRARWAS